MLPVKRPYAHPSHGAVAHGLCGAIRAEVAQGKPADFKNREMWTLDYEPRARGWNAGWGERDSGIYKRALIGLDRLDTMAKCVWCEQLRSWNGELHVDHFRPKGAVTAWRGDLPQVLNKAPPQEKVADGYWWLAHAWENWNLACYECNSTWKRNLFPRMGPHPLHAEGVEENEVLLLLDPTSDFETRAHFFWDHAGYMFGRTEVGLATVITCGLNRGLLVKARMTKVPDILQSVTRFKHALAGGHDDAIDRTARQLACFGDSGAEFAGMARHLVESEMQDTWESLFGS